MEVGKIKNYEILLLGQQHYTKLELCISVNRINKETKIHLGAKFERHFIRFIESNSFIKLYMFFKTDFLPNVLLSLAFIPSILQLIRCHWNFSNKTIFQINYSTKSYSLCYLLFMAEFVCFLLLCLHCICLYHKPGGINKQRTTPL